MGGPYVWPVLVRYEVPLHLRYYSSAREFRSGQSFIFLVVASRDLDSCVNSLASALLKGLLDCGMDPYYLLIRKVELVPSGFRRSIPVHG